MCYMWVAQVGLAAASAWQASQAQKAQAQYQSQVAANNAKVAEIQAQDAEARGNTAAQETHRRAAYLAGTQRAAFASRGIDISDGSANATLQDTDFFGALDEQTVHTNAAREAWGYRVRAANSQGDAAFFQRSADATNPLLSAGLAGGGTLFSGRAGGGTLFSGGDNSVASKWYRGWQAGRGNGG